MKERLANAADLLWELTGVSLSAKEAQRMLARADAVGEGYAKECWADAVRGLLSGRGKVAKLRCLLLGEEWAAFRALWNLTAPVPAL